MHRCWIRARLGAGMIILGLAALGAGPAEKKGPIGFAPSSRAEQAQAEQRALAVPTPEKARAWLRALTEEPHVAGTPADYDTAVDVRDKLRSWGWKADLAEYHVLLNYPVGTPVLEILRPSPQKLKVVEDPLPADKDSASPDAFPAFHGYGVSGDVRGQVVYANYGRPDDFKVLERLGVAVKGKIVLVRYGELFRGLKVREAQKQGAKGILIYSDPADDGYARGDVYPNGPYRPPSALQRGSVQFLSLQPGDPSTPNSPSTKGAKRGAIDVLNGLPLEGGMIPDSASHTIRRVTAAEVKSWEKETGLDRDNYYATIPSLPLSYEAVQPILEALGGPNVPSGWQGGLPLPYHTGPGPAEVHFAIQMDYKIRPIWNVIATIKGSAEPDRWVMIGNHRDAWVYGAVDPGSGTAATLEMCRALGEAVKAGWKPRRTIVYASWDAEEYGLVGSTEWAEDHAHEIDTKAVLMLNVDSAVSGPELDLDGVPSLRDFVLEAASAVTDHRTGKDLREVWTAKRRESWAATGPLDYDLPALWDRFARDHPSNSSAPWPAPSPEFFPQLNTLGSGSDYTVFLDHLGVPVIDVSFGGRYGVYHSIYDDFFWMEKFGDPEFLNHANAAKLYTLIAMRAAGAEVLPFRFGPYAAALREYIKDLLRTVARKARSADPPGSKFAVKDAARGVMVPFEGLPDLIRAVHAFQAQAGALDRATAALASRDGVEPARLARVNDALQRIERAFLHPAGLPGRPWFKHTVYAPGLTTGYACWPLPGVQQAILQDNPPMLAAQVPILVERIEAATAALRAATLAASDNGDPGAGR